MKKITLLIILINFGFSQAQIVNIPDINFKNALLNHNPIIDTNNDEEIQVSEAENILELLVSNKNISSLVGVEYFINLTKIDCINNNLTSLNVSENIALLKLFCSQNDITNLDLSTNINLTYLWFVSNNLNFIDLSNNINLESLDCRFNNLNALNILNNQALTHLWCDGNSISSLNVNTNIELIALHCNDNNLNSLELSNNVALTSLGFTRNIIESIDLSSNTHLTYLYSYLTNITDLDLSNQTELVLLSCGADNLTELDLSSNISLTELRFVISSDINYLDLNNGNNHNFLFGNGSQTSFSSLTNIESICVDNLDSELVSFIIDEVNHSVNFIENCNSLSINNLNTLNFSVYPTPTENILNIKTETKIVKIEIYNALGQLIIKNTVKNKINISSLTQGLYFVKVKDANDNFGIKKIVKK